MIASVVSPKPDGDFMRNFFDSQPHKVFAKFANNHHNDGHIAVWIPAQPGLQAMLIKASPETFFKPPYVGVRGWDGIELDSISDEELASHILDAWRLVAPKKLKAVPPFP